MSYPIKISAYKPKWSDKRKEMVPGSVPFDADFYEEMYRTRDGYYKEIIEKLRSISDYQESNDFKAQYLVSLTISCVTKEWRNKENIIERSGLMNIDLDAKDNPAIADWGALRDELFEQSRFIVSAWLSARGQGLTFVVRVDHDKFRETFETVKQDLLAHPRGLVLDKGLHDETRLRFVSWDPEIKIREDFENIPVYQSREQKQVKAPTIDFVPSTDIDSEENFLACLARAEKDYLFQDGQKHMYLSKMAGMANTIGMSLEYVEFMVMDKFASQTNIAVDDLLKPVRNIYRSYKDQHGQIAVKSDKLKGVLIEANRLNRQGIKPGPDTLDMIAEQQEVNIEEVERVFEKVFKENKEDFGIEEKPEIVKVQSYLNKKYDFAKNIVTQRAEYRKKGVEAWEQISADEIYKELQETGFKFDLNKVKSLLRTSFVAPYDPFQEYFKGLPTWNGKEDFITGLANHVTTDDQEFYLLQFKKALVRSIACTLDAKENRLVFTYVGEKQETGKCFAADTQILMFNGSTKKVQDIIIGDLLMGPDSKPRTVLALNSGNGQLYRVHQNKGIDYTVNGEHVLSLKTRPHRTSKIGGELISIPVEDYLKQNKTFQFNQLGWKSAVDWPKQDVPLDPYFFGAWIGDGDSSGANIETMDPEMKDYLAGFAERNGMLISLSEPDNSKSVRVSITSRVGKGYSVNKIKNTLRELNVLNNKHIPDAYLYNDRESRLQLLAGLLDTDGSLYSVEGRYSFEFTQVSEVIAKQVEFLCRSLGFRATIKSKKTSIKSTGFSGFAYRMMISGNVNEIPTLIKRKQCTDFISRKNPLTTGIKVTKDAIGDFYGFQVDGDQLFMLEDFTVVHNSSFLRFLNPWGPKKYYTESPLRDGKDTEFRFSENFIYNLEELSSLNNIEINRLKAIISKSSIKERKPFATDEEEHPRRCNFWGSTNKAEFLTDTENTRWLCFVVQKINWDYRETVNIHHVWAQAYTLYKQGFDYQLTRDEMQRRDARNKEFEVITGEKELVQKYFKPTTEKEMYAQYMTNTEIIEFLVEATSNRIKINPNTLGKVMTQLGFERKTRKINNKSVKGYFVHKNTDIQGFAKYDTEPTIENEPDDLPF